MNTYLFVFIIFIIMYFYALASTKCNRKPKLVEGLNEEAGGFCETCDGLTFGQCMKCYNCGFCGSGYKGKCVNGTIMGPSKEKVNLFSVNMPAIDKLPQPYCPRYYQNDNFWNYLYLDKDDHSESASYVMGLFE
jgi:hypothetical protein